MMKTLPLCVALLLSPLPAFAHAHLEHASPSVGSTVLPAPKEIVIWFSEALEPKFSGIEERDASGAAMQDGPVTLGEDNSAELHVPLKPLPPGAYTVMWHVLSVDTHRTQGNFSFTVGK